MSLEFACADVRLVIFDFDGVFTDNTVYVDQNGVETVRCWRSDGLGLARLREVGVKTYIVSTETNPVVAARAEKLKIPCKHGISDKGKAVLETCTETGTSPEHTMFVGNDINDIPAFKVVKFPVAVGDAHPEVSPYVVFRTDTRGGFGAVREICDLIYGEKRRGEL